ncbi:MAG: hypothetical protein R6U44_00575 [Archaeoglobaceae archaeon]
MKAQGDVPESWRNLIEKAKEIEGWETNSAYVKELIKKDLVSKRLLGINSNKEAQT